jgi:hypothetical protein
MSELLVSLIRSDMVIRLSRKYLTTWPVCSMVPLRKSRVLVPTYCQGTSQTAREPFITDCQGSGSPSDCQGLVFSL